MRITQGQIDASDVTTRLLFPTSQQSPWSPFERFAETIATARKKEGLHSHNAEEVVVYVLEGYVDHESDGGQPATLTQGSVLVLTAHGPPNYFRRARFPESSVFPTALH